MPDSALPYWVLVGTYTQGGFATGPSQGVYVYRLDPADGTLTYVGFGDPGPNPSFLAVHPSGRFVYTVNEVDNFGGRRSGGVTAFAFDRQTGALTRLNQESAHGTVSCHISVDPAGRFALAANYGSGDTLVIPIRADGTLGPAAQIVDHVSLVPGAAPDTSHAHSANLAPDGRFVLVADLGLDRVMIYAYNAATGHLSLNPNQPWYETAKGAGPRHLDFHPSGRYVYVINELNSTLTALAYDPDRGLLTELQTLSTLPAGYSGGNSCADVHVSPDGRFVYGSNRGHDSLAAFSIDPATGLLTLAAHTSTAGRTPRNFNLDPTGRFVYVGNQDTAQIVVFRRDAATGALTLTGQVLDVPSPVCIKFLAAA
ncbi:MAG: lactonase family protein [Anaerolineales bacterium]|nr:lactonase family protein [Anaerolineales bacterium]